MRGNCAEETINIKSSWGKINLIDLYWNSPKCTIECHQTSCWKLIWLCRLVWIQLNGQPKVTLGHAQFEYDFSFTSQHTIPKWLMGENVGIIVLNSIIVQLDTGPMFHQSSVLNHHENWNILKIARVSYPSIYNTHHLYND